MALTQKQQDAAAHRQLRERGWPAQAIAVSDARVRAHVFDQRRIAEGHKPWCHAWHPCHASF